MIEKRHPRGLARGALALLLSCTPAFAQKRPEPIEITRIDWGFGDRLRAEAWSPVTLWLTSPQGAFVGTLTVEYVQDATQPALASLAFSTTPGMVTPTEVLICPPAACSAITFTFDDGDQRKSFRYDANTLLGSNTHLPTIESGIATVLVVAPATAARAFAPEGWTPPTAPSPGGRYGVPGPTPTPSTPAPGAAPDTDPAQTTEVTITPGGPADFVPIPARALSLDWKRTRAAAIEPTRLPLSWMAYDCTHAVVIPGDMGLSDRQFIDPRALEALQTWVSAGGRLVIAVEGAGDAWSRFVPPGLVSIAEASRTPIGHEFAAILDRPDPFPVGDDSKRIIGPVDFAQARPIRLTERGAAAGWRIRWRQQGGVSAHPDEVGLLAQGPVGLGMVTLVGVDPSRIPQIESARAAGAIWRDALLPSIADRPGRLLVEPSYGYSSPGSGGDPESRGGIKAVFDGLADVPGVGDGAFIMIAASVLMLALLLGPIDSIVLKRLNERHRSWLTSLGWIALASVVAYVAPALVRSGDSRLGRTIVVDKLLDPRGDLCWQDGATAIFAGRPLRAAPESVAPGSWWRGASSLSMASEERPIFSPMRTRQAAPDINSPRAGAPLPVAMPQWTFRTLLDRAPAQRPAAGAALISATIHRDGDDWLVALTNLPHETRVRDAALRTSGGWIMLTVSELPETLVGSGRRTFKGMPSSWLTAGASHGSLPGAALSLPGPRDRSSAIDAIVATGCSACLYLNLAGLAPDTDWRIAGASSKCTAVMRIVIPLDPTDRTPETTP